MHKNIRSLLERSRIIPAIRAPEFIAAAIASPALVVSLLYGNPMTLGDVVRKLRSAGKLPIANLDLLTGFAQDGDAVSLLVRLGVAGVVSTDQSVLRAAYSQGIIAMQRTFAQHHPLTPPLCSSCHRVAARGLGATVDVFIARIQSRSAGRCNRLGKQPATDRRISAIWRNFGCHE
jgi:hypothetical protein